MSPRFTEEQAACVYHLGGPLDISAGAGSGKTFTLTQRIVHALASPQSGIDDIDQVCAITFTRKAASELKGRVRSVLRAQGMLDQALKVDSAWISTIHGACSRILRAEALDLGIDPAFQVVEDTQRDELFAQALSEVLGQRHEIVDGGLSKSLLKAFPLRSFYKEASLSSLVEKLAEAAAAMPEGMRGFLRGPTPEKPSSLACQLLCAYEEVQPIYQSFKPSKTRDEALLNIQLACEELQAFIASGSQELARLYEVLDSCAFLKKIRSSKEGVSEALENYQQCHSRIAQNAALLRGSELLDELLALAEKVSQRFSQIKRAAGVLDNNDLVHLCLEALKDPHIGARYADRFRLVMVDEFQDTDALQIAIVRHLAGPNLRYLCTVGDAQQSIYRFRGADVNGYKAFRAQLLDPQLLDEGADPALLQLTKNFRSHGDVLAFVRKVCEQPTVFGSDFLDLSASYDGAGYKSTQPRIHLEAIMRAAGQTQSGDRQRARRLCAQRVAKHFAGLREAGHSASEMVLLLGGMTNSQVYAQALREENFACIVTGGSSFFTFPEVSVVRTLAQAILNPEDTAALFEVLESDMFRLSADDLLTLATDWDESWNIPKNRRLDKGLLALSHLLRDAKGPRPELSPALRQAIEVFDEAAHTLQRGGISRAVESALLNSGWLARLQKGSAEGSACIANILKAHRLLQDCEKEGKVGPSSAVQAFCRLMDSGAKDSPGVLNAKGAQAVRIMTIHASKGLEFPLVAVAELPSVRASQSSCVTSARAGSTCVSLMPKVEGLSDGKEFAKAVGKKKVLMPDGGQPTWEDALNAPDTAAFHSYLNQIEEAEEASEGQRLLYVAATRAKESLAIFMDVKLKKDDPRCDGVAEDIRSAFFGDETFPLGVSHLDYGGSEPASYQGFLLKPGDDTAGEGSACEALSEQPESLVYLEAPEVMPTPHLSTTPLEPAERGLFSYSSLSAAHEDTQAEVLEKSDREEIGEESPVSAEGESPVSAEEGGLGSCGIARPGSRVEESPVSSETHSLASPEEGLERPASDADKATDFGSAFHRLAQLAALEDAACAFDHLEAVARYYQVQDTQRLYAALERWFSSAAYKRLAHFACKQPEYPFALKVGDAVLEGEIDLIAYDRFEQGEAFIVDYKTGGSPQESSQHLEDKHRLQGQCYALAALSAGFEVVELQFVRVEQDDPQNLDSLQRVDYRYTESDIALLGQSIASCRNQG